MKSMLFAILCVVLCQAAVADTTSPYAGQESREIKSLSNKQIANYQAGAGMGFARAAELNHYPGPKHVLELADELALSDEQIMQTREIFDEMKARAMSLGKELVQKEQALDAQFAAGSIDESTLESMLMEIGELRASIRYTHLRAHLEQKSVLSGEQVEKYDSLRGYDDDDSSGHGHSH